MKKFFLIFALSTAASLTAQAGILVEPYFSYIVAGKYSSADASGNELGARLGYNTMLGLGFGVDALATGTHTYKNNGTSSDNKASYYGVFASYSFPILVRGYVSYLLENKLTASNDDVAKGTATKVGIQYTGLPFIAIGVEMYNSKYTKYKDDSTGVESDISESASHTNLVISAPFSF